VWRVPTPGLWNGGAMATAGGLVFQGHADGSFNAFDSATGKRLWRFDAQAGVLAPPISYRIKGRQYITVLSGFGTSGAYFGQRVAKFGWQYRSQQRRVLTFVLDGTAKLPPSAGPEKVTALKEEGFRPDDALFSAGAEVYGRRCITCHGVDARAAGIAPDLRASPIPLDSGGFDAVVREGVLLANGMPQFEEMTDEQLRAVRHYIRAEAQASE
jgi:quinohemoprotein ethanol dehydrogenase